MASRESTRKRPCAEYGMPQPCETAPTSKWGNCPYSIPGEPDECHIAGERMLVELTIQRLLSASQTA